MDSWLTWFVLLVLTVTAGIYFVRYSVAEYEEYLERRQNGWQ